MRILDDVRRLVSNRVSEISSLAVENRTRVLFITEQNAICRSQIFPFYFFRKILAKELGFTFSEVTISEFQRSVPRSRHGANIVGLQPWFDIKKNVLQGILDKIRNDNPQAKIVFFDSFAPLDLRLAEFVNSAIDLYVKKHVFLDRTKYGQATKGDTNLEDYYRPLYGLDCPEICFPIPAGFLDKLIVGPSFATSKAMLSTFLKPLRPDSHKREIDLHARLGGYGNHWYGKMREHANAKVHSISKIRVVSDGCVGSRQFLGELRASKMCFSPFGYGEVCWRDYEAVMCGALLIKPDMSHVETYPDIFRPHETYVPIRWDFSDLEEKVNYFLDNEPERNAITQNAYSSLRNYFACDGFPQHVRDIMKKLDK